MNWAKVILFVILAVSTITQTIVYTKFNKPAKEYAILYAMVIASFILYWYA